MEGAGLWRLASEKTGECRSGPFVKPPGPEEGWARWLNKTGGGQHTLEAARGALQSLPSPQPDSRMSTGAGAGDGAILGVGKGEELVTSWLRDSIVTETTSSGAGEGEGYEMKLKKLGALKAALAKKREG